MTCVDDMFVCWLIHHTDFAQFCKRACLLLPLGKRKRERERDRERERERAKMWPLGIALSDLGPAFYGTIVAIRYYIGSRI